MFLEVPSPLQHDFRSWHDNFYHLHPKYVFRLEKLGFIPSIFLYLKADLPLCVSCIFGKARIRKCRTKLDKSGSIRKETDDKPGD